eukprot:15350946-Alexandrium_andersonii.AAC.1
MPLVGRGSVPMGDGPACLGSHLSVRRQLQALSALPLRAFVCLFGAPVGGLLVPPQRPCVGRCLAFLRAVSELRGRPLCA